MFQIVVKYLSFLKKSTNEHGVHSPFVYELITKCLYEKNKVEEIGFYSDVLNRLKKSKEKIEVTDFGKGSKVFKTNYREVAKIAKVASIKKKNALMLMRLVKYLEINTTLEIGTSLGVGTSCLAKANLKGEVVSVEGCPNTAAMAQNQFDYFKLKNINLLTGEFSKVLPELVEDKKYDLIYFDGNHTKKATLEYFKLCLPSIHNNTVFIFDDIHWSDEMDEAWEEIKKHEQVKVTLDTFQWGLVFFRKEQVKEHFVIRV
ncbi:O-methyltransferase [Flavicella sediminum]|uniref:O-methyltransferase n=1 Tax=Flavicella sediminum TaxID=2585141 RepID=UPI0011241607|nr:class I SAM-dependent methyltransferase [Flavicella sediminum]